MFRNIALSAITAHIKYEGSIRRAKEKMLGRNEKVEISCHEVRDRIKSSLPMLDGLKLTGILIEKNEHQDTFGVMFDKSSILFFAKAQSHIAIEINDSKTQERILRLKFDAEYKRRCAFQARLERTTVREPDLFLSSGGLVLEPGEIKVAEVSLESHIESWLRISLTNGAAFILRSECALDHMAILNEQNIETYSFRFRRRELGLGMRAHNISSIGSDRSISGLQPLLQI